MVETILFNNSGIWIHDFKYIDIIKSFFYFIILMKILYIEIF